MVSLSDEERQRFAAYLEQDAMAKKMRAEAAAARIIAAKLRSIETQAVR